MLLPAGFALTGRRPGCFGASAKQDLFRSFPVRPIIRSELPHPFTAAAVNPLRTIPGVGDVVARTFIAELPELGTVDRYQIAALLRAAPTSRDSGRFRAKRKIRGGRPQVRARLLAACLSVIQFNKPLRALYRRLVDSGKEK
jgi:transposase